MTGKNFWSLIALLLLGVGTFCYVILIFQEKNIVQGLEWEEYYKAGASVSTSFVVLILAYLTATSPGKTTGAKMFIMFILIAGLIAEIVLMLVPLNTEEAEYGKYALLSANFLLRSYYILKFIQEPWAEFTFDAINQGIKKVTPTAIMPSTAAVPPVDDALRKTFRSKWNEITTEARTKYPGDVSAGEGESIIQRAINAGEFTKDKLNEAAASLKKKSDGSPITGLTIPSIGGRRRKH